MPFFPPDRVEKQRVPPRQTGAAFAVRSTSIILKRHYWCLAHLQDVLRPLAHQEVAEPMGIVFLRQCFEVMRAPTLLPGQSCQGNGLRDQHELAPWQPPATSPTA